MDYKGEEVVSASAQRTFRTERKTVFYSIPQSRYDLLLHGVDFVNRQFPFGLKFYIIIRRLLERLLFLEA